MTAIEHRQGLEFLSRKIQALKNLPKIQQF